MARGGKTTTLDEFSQERGMLGFDGGTEFVDVDITHELGTNSDALSVSKSAYIPPSQFPTVVTLKSEVVGSGIQRSQSPAYMATVRRRKVRTIVEEVKQLQHVADREDLTVWTFPIVENLKQLIATLAEAEQEGNTREILRQLRNTLLNGGWNKYRDARVRATVTDILERVANAEEIHPEDVDSVFTKLHQAGLNPVGSSFCVLDEESEDPDVEEKVEVSN